MEGAINLRVLGRAKDWRNSPIEATLPSGDVVTLRPLVRQTGWHRFLGKLKGIGLMLMGAMTNPEEAAYLNYRFRGGAMAALTNAYIGLMTVTAGETGGGTEVTGNNYSRLAMAQADWDAPVAGEPTTIQNTAQKLFAQATGGNWGTVVAITVNDASTAGTVTHFGALAASKTINDGDNAKFNAGALKIGQS